jgi:hypothetical protein
MKKLIVGFLVLSIIFSGCASSKKQFGRGNYDAAIEKSIKKLRKKPNDEKEVRILMDSYRIANERNHERIRFLKLEGSADRWDEVFRLYQQLNSRQSLVRTVMPLSLNGRLVDIQYIDYAPDMVEAQRRAADYYFANGNRLMQSGLKENYRQAYNEFRRVKQYAGDYPGIDNRINEARYMGISRVFVSLQNNSFIRFPEEFERDLLAIDLPRLSSEWIEYHAYMPNNNIQYDYFINVNVNNIVLSPNQISQKDSKFSKEVEDGFAYQLDRRGNVMKDSLGNDIRIKKYKTLQCVVVETTQRKSCVINGNIEFIQANQGRMLKREPIRAQSNFEDVSSRAIGDIEALPSDVAARTRRPPAPFPTDIDMILMSSEGMKRAIREAIQNNRRYIN